MGDFNYRGIDWTRMTGDGNAEEFLNVIQDGFYQQLIREPTRLGNMLDLVFTNNETLVSHVEIGDRFDESDHNEIRFKINAKRKKEQNIALMPDFRKANYQGLRTHLQSVNWEEIGEGRGEDQVNEVEGQYNGIVRQIQMAQEQLLELQRGIMKLK